MHFLFWFWFYFLKWKPERPEVSLQELRRPGRTLTSAPARSCGRCPRGWCRAGTAVLGAIAGPDPEAGPPPRAPQSFYLQTCSLCTLVTQGFPGASAFKRLWVLIDPHPHPRGLTGLVPL